MIPNNFDTAFEQVIELVNDFNKDLANCTRPDYNESQVRKDYIDKFFIALGWDVNHEQQRNIYAQEVRVERTINVAARTKFADYSFTLAPEFRKAFFFVEAKKPSITLETPANCFQTLRYGYSSSKANLSILTNFKQLIVLDCRYLPDFDTATQRIHRRYEFTDFLNADKFAEIYYLFGREAVADGTYERVCSELPKPKGRVKQLKAVADGYKEIDDSFLEMLEGFREELAKNFKKKNPALGSDDLTEAVQRTLDRLVFIRFLEDKLIEPDTILDKFKHKTNAWGQFIAKSREFDKTYNGIIFKYHDVIDNREFVVDDRVFLQICDTFAGDRTPYHFNYIPIHILGSIYERFLGNVIVATAKQARIEAKPEVRKAGGVFYTPQYIVKYIVENTVGALLSSPPYEGGVAAASVDGVVLSSPPDQASMNASLENHPTAKAAPLLRKEGSRITPQDVARMRFADIACGSGSFLLGVYDYLLAWHTGYYNKKSNAKEAKDAGCIVNEDGTFHLSFEQKSDILVNNVYGVDIDRQAHEVTQLSLFLKLLEEETLATKRKLWDTERKAMLPSLANNIICGNALVDWDISSGDLFEQVDQEKEKRLNPMSFESKFPTVMRNGGFDAIVGNPPYGGEIIAETKKYFERKYQSSQYKTDSFAFFIEQSVNVIMTKGCLGYIVPNTWLDTQSFSKLRNVILEDASIKSVVNLGKDVFRDANIDTLILLLQKEKETSNIITVIDASNHKAGEKRIESPQRVFTVNQSDWKENEGFRFDVHSDNQEKAIFNRMWKSNLSTGDIVECSQGLIPYNTKEMSQKNPYISDVKQGDEWKPLLDRGNCIARYELNWNGLYIKFGNWLYTANKTKYYENEKILIQRHRNPSLSRRIVGTYDKSNFYFKDNLCCLILRDDREVDYALLFVLGVVNSTLLNFYYKRNHTEVSLNPTYLKRLPLPYVNLSNADEKAKHDLIVHAVGQIMDAKVRLATAKNDGERQHLTDKCEKFETDINTAVYSLYNLTADEIKLIEGA